MEQRTPAILLCGNRIALPVLRNLVFQKQVDALVIPSHCTDFIEQVNALLKNSGIDIITVTRSDCESRILEAIKKHNPVIGIMFSFSFKLTPAVYTLPLAGFYNIHSGPLPGYRGPDPVFWQIRNREAFAAVTIHKVDEQLDCGEIVLLDKIRLSLTDTHGILTTKLGELAALMTTTLLKMAGYGIVIRSRPQDNSKANYYHRQTVADISIDWETMKAAEIIALIQACNPWNKGAVTKINQKVIRLLDAHVGGVVPDRDQPAPGTILALNEAGISIRTIDAIIVVTMIYCEEGFFPAMRLHESGIAAGYRFDSK